jgi:hypothetical protein
VVKIGWRRVRPAREARLVPCDRICRAERMKDQYIVSALRDSGWRVI